MIDQLSKTVAKKLVGAGVGLPSDDIELWEAAYDLPPRVDVEFSISLPDKLRRAIADAMQCEKFIEPEQDRIRKLLKAAREKKVPDPVEIDAREYQIEYVEKYLKRAAALAVKRYNHFQTLTTREAIDEELVKCSLDIHYWFEMYAWGYDPRARTPLSVVPFNLFNTQSKYVDWLDEIVFDRRTSGVVEKARDEGATETTVRWGLYHWRFREGFSMLLSSRKEDEVDSKKNQNTIFERVRYQMRLLPTWMLPKKFDLTRDMASHMLIANPENGNTLLGEAPVANMGRGGRVTCTMLDEFAFWGFGGYPQFRSLSQTSDSHIMPSSVAGRLNQYADLAYDGVTQKFTMDWRDNPFKDKRWYDALPFGYIGPKMSRTTIAQEIDRNYDAAQPGKVWTVREEFVFITLDEFLKPFKEKSLEHRFYENLGDGRKRFRIPADWQVFRHSDYGQSEGHDWGYSLIARPTGFYPLADTHFVFFARNLEPTGLRTNQAVSLWRGFEQDLGLRDKKNEWIHPPFASYISHEQKRLRQVLRKTYGEIWHPWKTDYHEGIEQIQDWWTPVDLENPNPHRPELMGRCKFIFVAPNGNYIMAYNDRLAQHFVTMSQTEAAFMTARKQISAYHYPETELGKAVKKMRPVKEFDDIIDTLRSHGVMHGLPAPKMTQDEAFRKHLEATGQDELLRTNLDNIEDDEQRSLTIAREQFERAAFDRESKKGQYIEDDGVGDRLREQDDNMEWREL